MFFEWFIIVLLVIQYGPLLQCNGSGAGGGWFSCINMEKVDFHYVFWENAQEDILFHVFIGFMCQLLRKSDWTKIASTFKTWKIERNAVPIISTEKWRIIVKLQSIMIVFVKSKDHPNMIIILFWISLTKLLRTWPSYWRWNAKYFENYLKTLKFTFQLLKCLFCFIHR